MRTARLLTVSRNIPCNSGGGLPNPLPPMQTPLVADTHLIMWPVMHAGKPPPLPTQWTEWHTGVKTSFAGGNKPLKFISSPISVICISV